MSARCTYCDYGGTDRRAWVRMAQRCFLNAPGTLLDIVEVVILGFLVAAVLVVGVGGMK